MQLIRGIGILEMAKKIQREDPVFGSMLYMGDRLQYWEGKALFTPTSSAVEVFVDGLANDDMEQQHGFFASLAQEWPSLSDSIHKLLLKTWSPREALPASSWEHLKLSSISIPKGTLNDSAWELSFSAGSDGLLTVRMQGREPQTAVLDD